MPNQFNSSAAESYSAFADETPAEKLAKQVNDKVSHNLLEAAYADLKKGVDSQIADMPLKEKNAFWDEVASHLDQGAITKLSSVFLVQNFDIYDSNKDGKLKESELFGVKQAANPFYRGLGSEVAKNFSTASSLYEADGSIDKNEATNFRARQVMPTQDQYTDAVIANVIRRLGEPVKAEKGKVPDSAATVAMEYLSSSMSGRAALETSAESQATWKQLSEKLAQNGLVEKLSMAYLKESRENLQMKEGASFSMQQLSLLQKSLNPVRKQFADYIATNFESIASVRLNDPLNQISEDERQVYERKMNKKVSEAKPKQ